MKDFIFSIGNEAKKCIHKKLSKCDIKEPSELSDLYFDFILNNFDCEFGNSFWLYFGIVALIILLIIIAAVTYFKRR